MTDPTFGISIRRVDEEARPVLGADLSTIGLVGPAPGADPDAFPLNTPVLTRTNDGLLVRKLGTQGYLRDALEGIADQLGELQRAARTIVVRTQAGEGDDPTERLNQTIAGIVGSSTEGTGIHALTRAPSLLGFTPRLIIVPGYTGQTALSDTVGRIAQTYRGRGYVQGETYELEFAGGDPTTPAAAHAIGQDDGSLGYAIIDEHGAGYQSAPTVTAPTPEHDEDEDEPEGRPATFLAYMGLGANPVCAALPFVLEQLLGHAVVESSGINLQNDFDWRETMQSSRLIAISGGVQVFDSITGAIVARPLAPRVVGIAVRRDHEQGAPFHSWANQPVQGIIAPGRDVDFSILDGENEGQELLNANIGVLGARRDRLRLRHRFRRLRVHRHRQRRRGRAVAVLQRHSGPRLHPPRADPGAALLPRSVQHHRPDGASDPQHHGLLPARLAGPAEYSRLPGHLHRRQEFGRANPARQAVDRLQGGGAARLAAHHHRVRPATAKPSTRPSPSSSGCSASRRKRRTSPWRIPFT